MELVREMLPEALAWHREPPRPPLYGDELDGRARASSPGPRMGEILERLRAAAFAGEVERSGRGGRACPLPGRTRRLGRLEPV